MPTLSLPIEHYLQEEDAGCLAACTQMILANLGITISQAKLNQLFELTPLGVPLSRLRRLDRYGVNVVIYRNGTWTTSIKLSTKIFRLSSLFTQANSRTGKKTLSMRS